MRVLLPLLLFVDEVPAPDVVKCTDGGKGGVVERFVFAMTLLKLAMLLLVDLLL